MPRNRGSRKSHTDSSNRSTNPTLLDTTDTGSAEGGTTRSFGVDSKSTAGHYSAAKSVRSGRSAAAAHGGGGGKGKRGDQEVRRQLALRKKYEQECETKQQIYNQLAMRHDEQRRLIERMSDALKKNAELHRQNVEAGRLQIHQSKEAVQECIERTEQKKQTIVENRVQIQEWKELLLSDEVRRAHNFILRNPNPDLIGVKPEEVFGQETMRRFYACKNRIKFDRKLEAERSVHIRLSVVAAALAAPAACVLIHDIEEAHKFRKAVMKSVGMRARGNNIGVGGEWLLEEQQRKEAEAETDALRSAEKGRLRRTGSMGSFDFRNVDPLTYGDFGTPEALLAAGLDGFRPAKPYATRPEAHYVRLSPSPPPPQAKLTALQAMLAECRRTIGCLEFIGAVDEPEQRRDMLQLYKSREFEIDRAEKAFDVNEAAPFFWKPLPGKLGEEPIARWK